MREKYVKPALGAGKQRFSVAVRDLIPELVAQGFPPGNTPQICTAPRRESFLREEGIEIESIDGPPSKMSTSVVFHFKVAGSHSRTDPRSDGGSNSDPAGETPEQRAHRLSEKLRGLLKEELAEYGGGEAFLRWVRGYDEEDAA
ncbi:MAG: hypothetical protein WBV33_06505 [Terracidiphilus sp.]